MPTTRRSAGNGHQSQGKQSTLSFNHRVTKSGPKPSAKDNLSKTITTPTKASPLSKQVKVEEVVEEKREDAPDVIEAKAEEDIATIPSTTQTQEAVEKEEVSEIEAKALKITDRQVEVYWKNVEAQRIAKRVHQEDLGVAEKVLRYFDVSSQYGPCIGITRRKRWERAERMGLEPPVEVLAVLLRDGGEGKKMAKGSMGGGKVREMAHMDDILNSTAVGAS